MLGVDPGARRIGLAISDDEGEIASPHATVEVRAREQAAREVAEAAASLGVGRIVIGLPLTLEGVEGEAARRTRGFAQQLRALTSIEIVLWDERLSSRAAERALREAGVRGGKRRQTVDRVAAALILQSYLDAHSRRERDGTDPER
jgi:putative Holliday junction resolvase